MTKKNTNPTRRQIIKAGTLALGMAGLDLRGATAPDTQQTIGTTATAASPSSQQTMIGVKFEPHEIVRLGIIGVGGRGTDLLRDLLAIPHVEVKAICDVVPEKAAKAQASAQAAGQKSPVLYTKNDRDYENLCRRDDLDLIYIATPWKWHVPMAVAVMEAGKHAAVEVPAATTLKDCWMLVETSEKTRRHCMMLENCCYGYNEMLVFNMVKAGLMGDLLHGEAAYNHDLREILFANEGEGLWRRDEHFNRDGNLYPTHGLGPVAHYLDINRGDAFDYLVSISSPSAGLEAYRAEHIAKSDAKWKESYKCGDVNTSIIKTARARTIMLQHTVSTPRPYDRINLISGTKGMFRDYPPRVYLDGQGGGEQWATIEGYKEKYEHSLWKEVGELARKTGGHGGMDFVMNYRLIQCVRQGLAPDMDVYDAAALSAAAPLSEMSVAGGSAPAKFPDFTRGRWKEQRTPLFVA